MWKHEVLAENMAIMLQLLIHKAGRPWDERRHYRPITLANDIMKIFDGCLYYMMARETGTIRQPVLGQTVVAARYLGMLQRAFQQHMSTLDLLFAGLLTQWRTRICGILLADAMTDAVSAFDSISHRGTDAALGAAGASPKSRNLFRMVYAAVMCRVRSQGAAGGVAFSTFDYLLHRGGCQGLVLMPLLFILLMHYVYKQHDSGHKGVYGPGEQNADRTAGADGTDHRNGNSDDDEEHLEICNLCGRDYPMPDTKLPM